MKNTYRGNCWERKYQGNGRSDDRKQQGKTRAKLDFMWIRNRCSMVTLHDGGKPGEKKK